MSKFQKVCQMRRLKIKKSTVRWWVVELYQEKNQLYWNGIENWKSSSIWDEPFGEYEMEIKRWVTSKI